MTNLAGTYKARGGDAWRAAAVLEQAYQASRRPELEDNPLTIALMHSLVVAYTRVDRLRDGKPLLVACHEWNQQRHGPNHPRTRASSDNLTWLLEKLGDIVKAPVLAPEIAIHFIEIHCVVASKACNPLLSLTETVETRLGRFCVQRRGIINTCICSCYQIYKSWVGARNRRIQFPKR
ncbi:uncharacterized protein BJX67DRAFT_80071 [Aspergillus lucknowensis]|uniref:Uncharacterized protein n=1 Tax=Aspergillus lucknowensis TaxID=176173 RepID=A0ABR4LSP9_9EURO